MKMYCAIAFMVDFSSGQSMTFSVPVETDTVDEVILALEEKWESPLTEDNCSDILVLENGDDCPRVIHHWTQEDLFGEVNDNEEETSFTD